MIERNVTLRLGDTIAPANIPVSQFDTMWRFVFSILYGHQSWEIPSGATAVLNGRKPDGNVFAFSGTVSGNKVTVDCDVQMTAVAGTVVCELSILSSGTVVGTANFILDVEAGPKAPDDVTSETALPAYGEILDRIAELEQASGVAVDSELSDTSENAVQNKVVKEALDRKVDAVSGKGLSTKDYTAAEKSKLAGIEAGAQKNPDLSGYARTTDLPQTAEDVGAIAAPSSPSTGDFLVWNGTAWVASTIPNANGVSF